MWGTKLAGSGKLMGPPHLRSSHSSWIRKPSEVGRRWWPIRKPANVRRRIGRAMVRANIRGVATRITEDLIGYPMITPTAAASRNDVTYPAANTAVNRLVQLGILEERTGRQYGRVFAARQVLNIINAA